MDAGNKPLKSRRNFLTLLIRGGIFTSFTLMSGVFLNRWADAEDCRRNFTCGNCNLSNHCKLPEADRYRLDKARGKKTKTPNERAGK